MKDLISKCRGKGKRDIIHALKQCMSNNRLQRIHTEETKMLKELGTNFNLPSYSEKMEDKES